MAAQDVYVLSSEDYRSMISHLSRAAGETKNITRERVIEEYRLVYPKKHKFRLEPDTVFDQSDSIFFGLPNEIRNYILELACKDTILNWTRRSGKRIEEKWTTDQHKLNRYAKARGYKKDKFKKGMTEKVTTWNNDGKPEAPGLMLVCKRMYEEAHEVFFYNASFVFDTLLTYRAWIRRTRYEKLELHRHVFVGNRRKSYKSMVWQRERLGYPV